jgi:hypothetical protein
MLLAGLAAMAQLPVADGFESKKLSKFWDTSRFAKGAVVMQNKVVKSGHSAAMVTVKMGEKYEAGNDSSKESERAELMEAARLVSLENNAYEYAFSMFIPADFPIVPTRLVIAQWKQYCGHGICEDDSPVLALRYVNGVLKITIQTGRHDTVVYQTRQDIRNQWTDFRVQANFSRTDTGVVKAWINGAQVLNYKGKSCYSSERGYPATSYFYFKMGLYRDKMAQPMTIYIDDYSKRQLYN